MSKPHGVKWLEEQTGQRLDRTARSSEEDGTSRCESRQAFTTSSSGSPCSAPRRCHRLPADC